MSKEKREGESNKIIELCPQQIVRLDEGPRFFGYQLTQLNEKIDPVKFRHRFR
jgi:hypothetical protein